MHIKHDKDKQAPIINFKKAGPETFIEHNIFLFNRKKKGDTQKRKIRHPHEAKGIIKGFPIACVVSIPQ